MGGSISNKYTQRRQKIRILLIALIMVCAVFAIESAKADYNRIEIEGIPEMGQRTGYYLPKEVGNPTQNLYISTLWNGMVADCGVVSLAMVEGYFKGYESNDVSLYHNVLVALDMAGINYQTITEDPPNINLDLGYAKDNPEFKSGYTYESNINWNKVYTSLENGIPVLVHSYMPGTTTNQHWGVIYGYDGSTGENINETKFKIMSPQFSYPLEKNKCGTVQKVTFEVYRAGRTINSLIYRNNTSPTGGLTTVPNKKTGFQLQQSSTVSGLTTTSAQLKNTVTLNIDPYATTFPAMQSVTCFIGTDKNAVGSANSSSHPNTYVCSSSNPQPVESTSTAQKYEFSFPTANFTNGSERPSLQKGATWYYRWEVTADGKTYSSGNVKAFQVTGWYDLAATKITDTDALLEGYVKYDLGSKLIQGGCFLSTSEADVSNATPDNHSNVLYVTDPASTFADKNNGYSDTSDYRYTRLYYTAQGSQTGSLGFETALKPGTTYYYKFYSIRPIDGNLGNLEVVYSDVRSFTTTGAAATKYQLTVTASEGGEIVNGIPGVYSENATVSMTAKAKKGYSFLKWETTAGTFTNPYEPTTLFAMTSSDAVVTARFVPDSANITLTPKTTDFGKVNQVSLGLVTYKRIVVTNNGSRAVTLVPKSGHSFTFEDQKAFHLEPGESDDLYVYASATLAPGAYSETLNIETPEGRVAGSLDFSIEVTKTPSGVSYLTISPLKDSDFGTWYVVAELPAARTFTVRYVGDGSVQLEQRVDGNAYFEISALSKTTLSANETATFTIRPKGNIPPGYHTASVEIKEKRADPGGLSCGQAVSIHVKQGAVAASPVRLDFAMLPAGYTAPASQTVTITNTGNMLLDLDMSGIISNYFNVAPVDHPEWTVGTRQILEGSSIQFSVQPKTGLPVGTYNEALQFPLAVENGTLAVTIPLSFTVGKSVDSGIDLNMKNLNFGAVEPYLNMMPPNAQTLRVTNTSARELVLAKPTATYFTVTASSYIIASKGTIQLDVQPKQGLAPGRYVEEIPLTIVSAIASQNPGNLRAGSSPAIFFKASYEVLPYRLVSGDDAQCAVGGEKDVEVVCNGDPNQLTQFLFGGLDITAKVKIGSVYGRTKVTIPVGVLNRFPAGIYTLTFVYRDGARVEARLTIGTQAAAENAPPQTGDQTPIVLYLALMSITMMGGIHVLRPERSRFRKG